MNYIKGVYSALIKILKHRVALAKAGRELGVSWQRIIKHDNSKFHPVEFMQYVDKFELGVDEPEKWAEAWVHHWSNNDHHIEYWENKNYSIKWCAFDFEDGDIINIHNHFVMPKKHCKMLKNCNKYDCRGVFMPREAVREMVADWMAASLAYDGGYPKKGEWKWGQYNLPDILPRLEVCGGMYEYCTRNYTIDLLVDNGMINTDDYQELRNIELVNRR